MFFKKRKRGDNISPLQHLTSIDAKSLSHSAAFVDVNIFHKSNGAT